jgi:2-methylisocitrate lyase-like PEP mutase family enzyme
MAKETGDCMSSLESAIAARRRAFRQLHESGCFVIPNPWDTGSARFLQGLGFKALATTSSGFAWSQGRPDNGMPLAAVLEHLRAMVAATDLPVNADFESGFAADAQGVATHVRLAVETGVAGLSIEDSTGDAARPLHAIDVAVERLRAARGAIDAAGGETLLVGRAENFIVGRPDLDDTLTRLRAYAQAGADCLYAPGIRTREQIAAVVAAVAPKPVNLLIGAASELTLADAAALGVRRISVGGALARSAWGGFMRTARLIAEQGRFDGFAEAASGNELNAFFRLGREEDAPKLRARVVGKVEYREGDGAMLTIPTGTIEVTTTAADATISWTDGASHGSAAMPMANFSRYVADGAIKLNG